MIRIIGCAFGLYFLGSVYAEKLLPFPAGFKDQRHLEDWVKSNQLTLPSETVVIANPEPGEGPIVVVFHSSGSGLPVVDAYLYGCDQTCLLFAVRRFIGLRRDSPEPLVAELDVKRSRLVIRVGGTEYLVIPDNRGK